MKHRHRFSTVMILQGVGVNDSILQITYCSRSRLNSTRGAIDVWKPWQVQRKCCLLRQSVYPQKIIHGYDISRYSHNPSAISSDHAGSLPGYPVLGISPRLQNAGCWAIVEYIVEHRNQQLACHWGTPSDIDRSEELLFGIHIQTGELWITQGNPTE